MTRSKGLSWFVGNSRGFRNARVSVAEGPPRGLDSALRSLRRRLDDRVCEVFHAACVSGDLIAAEKLLDVLQDMQQRRRRAAGERRQEGPRVIERARAELERCRVARGMIASE